MTLPRIEAIALVGSKNQRLFLSSRAQSQDGPDSQQARDETLRLEYAAHCSLDIIEERLQPRGVNEAATTPSYLGLVLNLEDLAVYAMATSTKLKILLLLRPGEGKVKDLDCLTVCLTLLDMLGQILIYITIHRYSAQCTPAICPL